MNRGKRLDIQALRAIAVVSVVIYHLWPNRLTGGFMGVDIFFVLSGFLMTSTIMRDIQPVIVAKNKTRAAGTFLTAFYARRIKRLVPAASVALLATLGLSYITGNLSLIQETSKQIVASALFFQNWFLANNSVDYLADTNPTAVTHFWSLSLEEQFYLVWPVFLLVLLLVSSGAYIVFKQKKVASLAIIPLALLIAGFFAYGYHLTQTQPSLAYFVTPARVWELLIGGFIAFLPVLRNYDLRLLLPWAGFTMIGYALFKWDGVGFPGWHAFIPTLGTALIIYAGAMENESKWSFENVFRFRPIQWIGDISYSLYLWHWPLIVLLPVLLFIDIDKHPQAFLIELGILALSLVMAYLSFRYVEQTTQHLAIKKRYIYSSFFAITALVAGLAYFTSQQAETTMQDNVKEVRAMVLDDSNDCIGAKSVFNDCEKSFGYVNNSFEQVASNDKYDFLLNHQESCSSYSANKYRATIGDYCTVGDISSKREISIWGDSHAQHWINPMDKIGIENNIKVNIIGTSYCFGSSQYKENCDTRFKKIKESGALDRSEAIIISMWHSNSKAKGDNAINAFKTLENLTQNNNIYLLEDTPFSGDNGGPECNILRQSCRNSTENATGAITQDSVELVELGAVTPNKIITTKDIFCDTEYCYSNIGGIPVYRDKNTGSNKGSLNSHMTASFAYSTWPMLEKKLKDAGIL